MGRNAAENRTRETDKLMVAKECIEIRRIELNNALAL